MQVGHTADSRYFNMELKNRQQRLMVDFNNDFVILGNKDGKQYTCNTLYIEPHKVADMLLDYICLGLEPIYINFLDEHIIVFNLAKLKYRPEKEYGEFYSRGYRKKEKGYRELLRLEDATIYDYNYNIIKRPNQ